MSTLVHDDPARRHALLAGLAEQAERALTQVVEDCRALADRLHGPVANRLLVFRVQMASDQPRLVAVDLASPSGLVHLGPLEGPDLQVLTVLHGDLVHAASRFAADRCSAALLVVVDHGLVASYPVGHCRHVEPDEPVLATWLRSEDPRDVRPHPQCCPAHLAADLLHRCGVGSPAVRVHSECDEEDR